MISPNLSYNQKDSLSDLSQGEVDDWQLPPLDQGAGDRTFTECLQRPQMSVALRKIHRHFPVHTPTTKKHIHTSGVSGSRPSFSHLRRKIREKSRERGALTLGPRRGWGNAVTLSTSPSLGWILTVPWPRTYYLLLKTAHAAPFSEELSSAGSLYSLTPGSDHMLWEFKRLDPLPQGGDTSVEQFTLRTFCGSRRRLDSSQDHTPVLPLTCLPSSPTSFLLRALPPGTLGP